MNGVPADPNTGTDGTAAGAVPPADLPDDEPDRAGTPHLTLGEFSGPLHHLLTLARAQKIDLAAIPLAALTDQLEAALSRATEPAREGAATPLGRKGDWVVMTAWLVQLRSLLLLPADAPGCEDAAAEADQLRTRLAGLEAMQALAGWLEHRPQLGHDVFARGRPELFGVSVDAGPAIDVVEFLWASMAQFDDAAAPEMDTDTVYQPRLFPDLYAVAEARTRILQRLAALPDGGPFDALLPATGGATASDLRRRSAWSSTLAASLELARQGDMVLDQDAGFQPIRVRPA
jgi:segregation and condensation protein A